MADLYPEITPHESGMLDFQAPINNPWRLRQVWPAAELVIVDNEGHSAAGSINSEIVRATQRFASTHLWLGD